MTDDTATADTPDTPAVVEDAPVALHDGEDGNPDDLAGDLTDPDVDVDALLTDTPDEDGA